MGGAQKHEPYETFSFLVLDLDRNQRWLEGKAVFRGKLALDHRRMAFKSINDVNRRQALIPFLQMAEVLNGTLVTFAVHKLQRPTFDRDETSAEFFSVWKPSVTNRLLWTLHLGAFLVSGLSAENQNVLFILDEDEVVANVGQLTKFTELFGRVVSNMDVPMLGHLRCGTTKSDDGSLALEDLAALPDLVAGGTAEFLSALSRNGAGPLSPLIQRMPSRLTWKTRTIMGWSWEAGESLDRLVCVIDSRPGDPGWRATIPRWFASPGVVTPPIRSQ